VVLINPTEVSRSERSASPRLVVAWKSHEAEGLAETANNANGPYPSELVE
jgi:hypothetical protein